MTVMPRFHTPPAPVLLDDEVRDLPGRFSEEDLYAEAGSSRRRGDRPFDEREDDR